MSDQLSDTVDAETPDAPRATLEPQRPLQVGDQIPLACGTAELARVFGKSRSRIRQLKAAGKFKRFELPDPIDRSKPWSGVKIQRYFEETAPARSFGARRVR